MESSKTKSPDKKGKSTMLFGVVLGVLAVIFTNSYIKSKVDDLTGGELKKVYVAARDISRGTVIQDGMIKTKRVPEEYIPSSNIESEDLIVERKAGTNIKKGDIILGFHLGMDLQKGFTSSIPSNERALTMSVDSVSGVAGLIKPSDRVDIIGTFTMPKSAGVIKTVTKVILQKVTVLAVGGASGSQYNDESQDNVVKRYNTITLSVTPREAELIVYASQRGNIRYLLRNDEDLEVIPESKMTDVDFNSLFDVITVVNKERKERTKIYEQGRKK